MLLSGALYVLGAIISFVPLVFFAITIKYYMDISKDPNAKPLLSIGLPKNKTTLIVIAITLLILQVVVFSQLAFIFRILI